MLKLDTAQIETIVQQVVARLRPAEDRGTMGPTPEESNSADAVPATVLRLPQRVVTLRLLEGRLQGIARVEVIPRAIVTPLVQDELRQRGVALERSLSDVAESRSTGIWSCVESAQMSPVAVRRAAKLLETTGIPRCGGGAETVLASLADPSRHDVRGLIVVTPRWAKWLCDANRLTDVSAVTAENVADLECVLSQVDANVLILRGDRLAAADLPFVLRRFVAHLGSRNSSHTAGGHPCASPE